MANLPPRLVEWLAVPFYWIHIFWLAIRDTYSLVVGRPLTVFTISAIAWLLTFGVQRLVWGRGAVAEGMRATLSAFIAVCLLGFLVFLFFLFTGPARLYEAQRKRAVTAETQLRERDAELGPARERLRELVQQLPPPDFQYVDTPTARADPYAWRLTEVFRAAGWHVEIRGEQWGKFNYKKLMMRIEDITAIRPNQRAVLDAFQEAQIPCDLLPGHNVGDRVELIVGEM